ncbi:hypothetical protein L218DRAFT_949304 [Marasmius fiardii PR-910]|nr:hypothetical protein L218DRAFT_949304 [Marasmius fiardii PR-910]
MHLQFLLPLTFSLTALTTLVGGAPTNYTTDTQAVTIQRFPLKQVSGQTESDVLQDLSGAMSKFKASSGEKLEHLYLGLVSGDPSVAEQIFLWKSPSDAASSPDITKPFAKFSSTGTFNHSTAVLSDKPTLLRALNLPITETILADILPEIPTSDVERDLSTLVVDLHNKGLAGGSNGIQIIGNTRTIVIVNGWESRQAASDWLASQDANVAAAFARFSQSFVGGLTPLFKNVVEIA